MGKYTKQEKRIPELIASNEGIQAVDICKQIYGSDENCYQKALAYYMKKNKQFHRVVKSNYKARYYTSERIAQEIDLPLNPVNSRKRVKSGSTRSEVSLADIEAFETAVAKRARWINSLWVTHENCTA